MELQKHALPLEGLDQFDDTMEPFLEDLVTMTSRFVAVNGKTIAEVMEALEALEELYDDYQGGLHRMYRARRSATVLTREQAALQQKIRLYYFTCREVKEVQQWLNGTDVEDTKD
ncbi:hypothetical protein SAMN05444008_101355 [Cnuella takakiae]|uniref:Uncharacterized protein n=1 Tax=Cnuella takakiae TaxID=1302690 RepID=A0A1M4T8C6_9BACT|nr:hypothetical protein [Cnuella takakiae]OLY90693.1 hypothetical protein BUE76_01345 [Cnuella takakiae]SHE40739.1 hypothetical protein SAMN05444008_101355 [Cnuella takakiae]